MAARKPKEIIAMMAVTVPVSSIGSLLSEWGAPLRLEGKSIDLLPPLPRPFYVAAHKSYMPAANSLTHLGCGRFRLADLALKTALATRKLLPGAPRSMVRSGRLAPIRLWKERADPGRPTVWSRGKQTPGAVLGYRLGRCRRGLATAKSGKCAGRRERA